MVHLTQTYTFNLIMPQVDIFLFGMLKFPFISSKPLPWQASNREKNGSCYSYGHLEGTLQLAEHMVILMVSITTSK